MNLLAACTPSNAKLAPKRYMEEGAQVFTPCLQKSRSHIFKSTVHKFRQKKLSVIVNSVERPLQWGENRASICWSCFFRVKGFADRVFRKLFDQIAMWDVQNRQLKKYKLSKYFG